MNTIIISDVHIPYVKRGYLDFCRDTAKKYRCARICHAGDLVDHHAISFHDHDPDGRSSGDELSIAKKELKKWFKAFPRVDCAIGNHDSLIQRQAFAAGLSSNYLRSFADAYDCPKGWRFSFEWRYDDAAPWRLIHGTGTSGHDAAFKSANSARISTAQGHNHTVAGVKYHASNKDIIWGLSVGSGIDRNSLAFAYGKDFKDKPIISVGLVLDAGRVAMVLPMPL